MKRLILMVLVPLSLLTGCVINPMKEVRTMCYPGSVQTADFEREQYRCYRGK